MEKIANIDIRGPIQKVGGYVSGMVCGITNKLFGQGLKFPLARKIIKYFYTNK